MIPHDPTFLDAASRLVVAFLLAIPLGWEAEQESRSAGLRTYPLLCVCVCGLLLIGLETGGGPGEQADVFYGMLAGIGFVGSGAMTTTPEGPAGTSTAVSLWVTGAIGAAVAYGILPIAAALSAMSFFASWAAPATRRAREGR